MGLKTGNGYHYVSLYSQTIYNAKYACVLNRSFYIVCTVFYEVNAVMSIPTIVQHATATRRGDSSVPKQEHPIYQQRLSMSQQYSASVFPIEVSTLKQLRTIVLKPKAYH